MRAAAIALASVLALQVAVAIAAADPGPTLKSCNQAADAKNLTGKERAAFVKDCLAGKPR